MEIQLSDFENAAFSIFVVLLTRTILSFDLNFYIQLSKVNQNWALFSQFILKPSCSNYRWMKIWPALNAVTQSIRKSFGSAKIFLVSLFHPTFFLSTFPATHALYPCTGKLDPTVMDNSSSNGDCCDPDSDVRRGKGRVSLDGGLSLSSNPKIGGAAKSPIEAREDDEDVNELMSIDEIINGSKV